MKSSALKRGRGFAASAPQRMKVTGQVCVVCGAPFPVDPAHVVPRGLGGCDSADCVVPVCREHHRAYDNGRMDLLPHLPYSAQAHAVEHLGIIGALERLTNERWSPTREAA